MICMELSKILVAHSKNKKRWRRLEVRPVDAVTLDRNDHLLKHDGKKQPKGIRLWKCELPISV